MKFKYFNSNDSKKETVGVVEASNLEEAKEKASQIKRLPLQIFLKLFKVETYL
jgi:hypothetical protein